MNDTVSPLTAPPPRYLLESDSSDEEGQGAYASSSRTKSPVVQTTLSWDPSDADPPAQQTEEVVVGVGQAGKYIAKRAGLSEQGDLGLVLHGARGKRVIARAWKSESGWIVNAEEAQGDQAWTIAQALADRLQAKRWTVLTTYVPAMYIPDPDSDQSLRDGHAPIRHLSIGAATTSTQTAGWESPNYFTGLAGAVGAMAAHPAHIALSGVTILALPLPLSYLDDSSLHQALTHVWPRTAQKLVSSREAASSRSRWTEQDDEPYEGLGMGSGKRREPAARAEVGTMYM